MPVYDFEYFNSANITVEVAGFPVLECAGLQYELNESRQPIYAYYSRHFDMVGDGQVLGVGTLLTNWVHQDYLFRAIEMGLSKQLTGEYVQPGVLTEPTGTDEELSADQAAQLAQEMFRRIENGEPGAVELATTLRTGIWTSGTELSKLAGTRNPHDVSGGLTLKVTAGYRKSLFENGETGHILTGVHFTGRGLKIPISAEVVVEAYPFLFRNAMTLKQTVTRAVDLDKLIEDSLIQDPSLDSGIAGVTPRYEDGLIYNT